MISHKTLICGTLLAILIYVNILYFSFNYPYRGHQNELPVLIRNAGLTIENNLDLSFWCPCPPPQLQNPSLSPSSHSMSASSSSSCVNVTSSCVEVELEQSRMNDNGMNDNGMNEDLERMKKIVHNEYLLEINDPMAVAMDEFVPSPSGNILGVHEPTFDLTMGETPVSWLLDRYPELVPEDDCDELM